MSRKNDLTHGPLAGHFRKLAIPAAIGMVFSTLYNVVDVYFAGMIGTDAQAGLAISFQAFFMFITLGFGLSSAMTALVGNALGAEDEAEARQYATQGVSFGLLVSLLLILVAFFVGPMLIGLISTPGAYRDAGVQYFTLLVFALPSFVLAYGLNGLLQSQGDTVSMQRALMGAFVANVILNPIFIFGIGGWQGFGFNGIALSTLVSQTGVMIYVAVQVVRSGILAPFKTADLIPDLTSYRAIIAQLAPTSFAMLVMMTAGFVVQYYLKSFGGSAVAAYGVALRVEQLFLLPVFGLTGALLPIAAQNFGAKNSDRVREALFTCWTFGWMFMAIACPILYFAAPLLMRVFTDDPEVIRIGISYLRVDGFILPIYMMLFAINSLLQALKKPTWTLWIGIYRQAFGVAFFSYIYVTYFDWGVIGIWLGIATSVLTGFLLSVYITNHVAKPLIGPLWGKPQTTSSV